MNRKFIPYSTQDIDDEDIAAVVAVLKSDFVTQGPAVEQFEEEIANYCGARYAVAVSSATAGLHVALAALRITSGSRVWTSPNSFVASANAARFLGADVGFVDVEQSTGNIDVDDAARRLDRAAERGELPDVLIPVHFSGRPCDMSGLRNLCDKYGIRIVEDAAHALGGEYGTGDKVGSCTESSATVFSFHPVKSVTTGEGGVITTNDETLARELRRYRSHGVTREPSELESATESENAGDWYYEQHVLGYNYRLTDIQSALGASQLRRLDGFVEQRRRLASRYQGLLADLPLRLPPPSGRSAWHLYSVQVPPDAPSTRAELFEAFRNQNVGVNVHYIPVHLQPYYRALGFKPGDFPNAEAFYAGALSLPIFPRLGEDQQDFVAGILRGMLCG